MNSEGLGEMFEVDSADTSANKISAGVVGEQGWGGAQTRKRGPPSAPAEFLINTLFFLPQLFITLEGVVVVV